MYTIYYANKATNSTGSICYKTLTAVKRFVKAHSNLVMVIVDEFDNEVIV